MPKTASAQIAVIGIDIGKNSFHVVGHNEQGAIVLRQKWSRGQIEARLSNTPPCLIGMEASRSTGPMAARARQKNTRLPTDLPQRENGEFVP